MKLKLSLLIILLTCACYASAQRHGRKHYRNKEENGAAIVKAYADSLTFYRAKADSLMRMRDSLQLQSTPDARLFKILTPLTFYNSVAGNRLRDIDDTTDYAANAIDKALINVYINRPELVMVTEDELRSIGSLHEDITKPIRHKVEYTDNNDIVPDATVDTPLEIVVNKPNFWTFSGDYYLQFLQNYVSSNWYKGGESNYSMVASATLQANYNNKQKLKFDNKLELKLGFQTARSDSLHSFKTTEDLIRYTGKLGVQATKKWYYTLQVIAYTQFMRGFKSNDPMVYSDILSPLNVNVSLGMSYNVSAFNKKLTGSVQLAPFAYNFRYVGRKALSTRYGLDEGKHTMHDFGSEFTVDLTWTLSDLIKWKTRLYGYTTYERAEIEWENTLSFQFNKYISSNIFVYPRFDDGSSKRDDHHGYWQFKEYASIGFAYSF